VENFFLKIAQTRLLLAVATRQAQAPVSFE